MPKSIFMGLVHMRSDNTMNLSAVRNGVRLSYLPWLRRASVLLLIMAVLVGGATVGAPQVSAQTQTTPTDGIVCTTGSSPSPTFTLTTSTGYIVTPDANVVFMWGFTVQGNAFQHPSPILCVNMGDTVTVNLVNTLNEPVSIIFPGQVDVLANGVPVQPQFNGSTMTSMAQTAAANGGTISYSFVASEPGTFIYQSGTNPAKQVRMGLFGGIIVRPQRAGYAYQTGDNKFNPSTEFMVMLSEIDPALNQQVERGRNFNMNAYSPRYYLLNGRGFPDSIAPNFASWLPSQPYGALVRIHPFNNTVAPNNPAYNPDPALVRYLNITSQDMPFHPHGSHGRVIGIDGQPLTDSNGDDYSFQKFAVNIGPGQTWDVTTLWYDAESYQDSAKPVPVTVPNLQNMVYGTFFGGSPYLGVPGPQPVGSTTLNQCGEYYIIAHNHSLYQITSWGIPMTGPITYMRIDPPLPNNCP